MIELNELRKLKEEAELVFIENENGKIINIKNKYNDEFGEINKIILNTLLDTEKFKVLYVKKSKQIEYNF